MSTTPTGEINSARPRSSYGRKNAILQSDGRPPWYTQNGRLIGSAFVIGIAGGSASGKVPLPSILYPEPCILTRPFIEDPCCSPNC